MWKEVENNLVKTFEFKNFIEAFGFMTKVALLAQQADHHPWWNNVYNKVEIKLTTHSEGNKITDKDKKLAAAIDKLYI